MIWVKGAQMEKNSLLEHTIFFHNDIFKNSKMGLSKC